MLDDVYSKAVFTVIALALSVIAWNTTFGTEARAQKGNCGSRSNPCYIKAADQQGNDEFVPGEGKGQEKGGHQSRPDQRQGDQGQDLPFRRP